MNKVILMGRLGQDPELHYTPSGVAVCDLSIATTEKWTNRDSGEKQEKTTWTRVEFWEKKAETITKYFGKGGLILVEGQIETQSWEDKETKEKRYKTFVRGRDFEFCGDNRKEVREGDDDSRGERGGRGGGFRDRGQNSGRGSAPPADDDRRPPPAADDDIPF